MSSTCLAARHPRELSQIWHLNTWFAILEWSPYIKFRLLSIPRITWNHFCKSGLLRFIWQRLALYVCNILILSYCIAICIVTSWILPAHIYGNDPLRLHFPSHNWQMAETDRSLLPSSSTSLIRGHVCMPNFRNFGPPSLPLYASHAIYQYCRTQSVISLTPPHLPQRVLNGCPLIKFQLRGSSRLFVEEMERDPASSTYNLPFILTVLAIVQHHVTAVVSPGSVEVV